MTRELGRWLIALGSVGAAVGITVLGMGMSFVESDDSMIRIGVILIVVGGVATVVGALAMRSTAEPVSPGRAGVRSRDH